MSQDTHCKKQKCEICLLDRQCNSFSYRCELNPDWIDSTIWSQQLNQQKANIFCLKILPKPFSYCSLNMLLTKFFAPIRVKCEFQPSTNVFLVYSVKTRRICIKKTRASYLSIIKKSLVPEWVLIYKLFQISSCTAVKCN